ncbi:MAG: ATP-dependent RecD-like DNA helicase [Chlamydiales bacterium]|nr:ATP-dependent RecD-like DNA helicase [Chlamydiales bacterium]
MTHLTQNALESIVGYIERITFHSSENGFTVARLKEPKKSDLTTIVGSLPALQPGETVRLLGIWKFNSQHGMQFDVRECHMQAPADLHGIQKYLESGLIKGIGPVFATRIVNTFGLNTLDIIDKSPDALLTVQGIGDKKLERIKTCWGAQKSIREVMIFLQQYGVSPSFAQKIYKTYGDQALEKVKENPYRMAQDIHGIGFKSADTIAQKMGFDKTSDRRIQAGIEFVLQDLATEGHVCYPEESLILKAEEILEVPSQCILQEISALQTQTRIVRELFDNIPFVWLKMYYICEQGIGREIKRLLYAKSTLRSIDEKKAIPWVQQTLQIELATEQAKAVALCLQDKFHIITGGPGTGKSTITKAILTILDKVTSRILLAAPTGRAAKRMSEITKKEAKTLHALLEWSFTKNGFKRSHEMPLECDLIIIDESSMIDTFLMYSLLKAIPDHARVIFLGDINQLPSVGAGNVLKDLIASKKIPVTTLNEIFRQAKGSKIITNAHLINEGKFPDIYTSANSDFFFMKREEPEEILNTIVELVTKRLTKRYRFDPFDDIQVLVPMKRGPIGTERLNIVLQEVLNPSNTPLFASGRRFHLHDKVMQIRNNYNKNVYNGDVGRITGIDTSEQEVILSFDGRKVVYEFSELDELVLAYAVSIHKYQGSESPCVIIPVHTTHFVLLNRNLIYTGVTRGKKLVVLVGTAKALHIAVNNDEVKSRYTGLIRLLA